MGCDNSLGRLGFGVDYFNPRTPVGCDGAVAHVHDGGAISIHAPQWGATGCDSLVSGVRSISIHAPQWGATRAADRGVWSPGNFNPRTPVGCDRIMRVRLQLGDGFQSTHPSGVRRWCACHPVHGRIDFNPRTPVGCDSAVPGVYPAGARFQSTHPSGVRRGAVGHERGHERISIHAPQWGATRPRSWRWSRPVYFNPRTPVGCD